MKKLKFFIIDLITMISLLILVVFLVSFGQLKWREITIICSIIYGLNTLFVIYLLIQNDELQEKFTWTFFLIVIPIISHVIFTLFRIRRSNGMSRDEYEKELLNFSLKEELDQKVSKNVLNIANKYSHITSRNFHCSDIKIFKHGFDAYEQLFLDIQAAKKFIHLEMYIIKGSEIFEKFKSILVQKAHEGVEIKIIFDAFGSWIIKEREFEFLREQGIEIAFFNKTFYPYVKPTDNNRLHRKFFVIDGEIVHSGGINISDEYSSYSKDYGYWIDLNFSIKGKIVNDYETLFLYDWFMLTNKKIEKEKYLIAKSFNDNYNQVLMFDEGPNNYENLLENSLIDWILNSKKTIRITTPYFIPSKQLINALKHSLKKGVKIDLFIPGKPDKKIVYNATKHFVNELVKLGANVYVMNNMFLHTKLMIFDSEYAYLGTNNLDMRSLYTNYELMNIVVGNDIINQMNVLLDEYQRLAIKIDLKKESKALFNCKKIVYELFSPLM